jgi:hypothetical protein
MVTLTARQFSQDTSAAKRAARFGPVFITDRGRKTHVLQTIDDFENGRKIPDSLGTALISEDDFELPHIERPIEPFEEIIW